MSEAPPRRPAARAWLLIPLVLAALAIAGWCAYWFVARNHLLAALDAEVAAQGADGREIGWSSRRVEGFPYRFKLVLADARVVSPSGWALRAPRLEAQANAYRLTRWVAVAPQGLVVVRPVAGPLRLDARVLRASLVRSDDPFPRISVEGVDLRFTPMEGAEPFLLSAAERVELHLRPATDAAANAQLLFRVRGAQPRPAGLMAFISGNAPANLVWDSRLTQTAQMRGDTWAAALRRWARSGGRMEVQQASLQAGDLRAQNKGGLLSVSSDGRLRGQLRVMLNRPLQALSALGRIEQTDPNALGAATALARARGEANVELHLGFEAGQFTVGPVAVAPAPKVF